MGLIIKESLKKMMKGYPTISDKYDVEGGVNRGSLAIKFGDLVVFTSALTAGQYAGAREVTPVATGAGANIAGICVAENVKLVTTYPGQSIDATIEPGEAVTLMTRGFIAVEIATADAANCKANVAVYYDTTTNVFTSDSSKVAIAGAVFTGAVEGNLAEIRYNI